jgi:hypothetical protein
MKHPLSVVIVHNRQVVQSRMEPHAAFGYCAKPRGILNCPWLFLVLSVVQSLHKTVIRQPEVRWVGWAGMRSRYSDTSLQLHPAPLGLLTLLISCARQVKCRWGSFAYVYLCFMSGNVSMKKKTRHIQGLFFSVRICTAPKSRMRLHTALHNLSNETRTITMTRWPAIFTRAF